MVGIIETIRRNNDNYRARAEADETYAALAKLFGIDQQQPTPGGILGPTDAERDAYVNLMAPGGQATDRTMQAVRDARESARAAGVRPPDPAAMGQQPQQPQRQLPPNTQMMLDALRSGDPYVIDAARKQMPAELFPNTGGGDVKPFNNWGAPVSDPSRDPEVWEENFLTTVDGQVTPTGQYRRRRQPVSATATVNMPENKPQVDDWDVFEKNRADMNYSRNFIDQLGDESPENIARWQGEAGFEGMMKSLARHYLGAETKVDELKKNFNNIVNKDLVASLPAGPASDRDIMIFMQGLPSRDSNRATMLSYVRGLHKAQYVRGEYLKYRARMRDQVSAGRMSNGEVMELWEKEGAQRAMDEATAMYPPSPAGGGAATPGNRNRSSSLPPGFTQGGF